MSTSKEAGAHQSAPAEPRAPAKRLTISALDEKHRDIYLRGLGRIMATDLAFVTYSQIIDGWPLADVGMDASDEGASGVKEIHPVYEVHDKLCDGVTEKARAFRSDFRAEDLSFDAKLLYDYQAAGLHSRAFNIHLVELLAISIHQVAVILHQKEPGFHVGDELNDWKPDVSDEIYWECRPRGPRPTLFYHPWYDDQDKYPDGVSDMVGYWAEARIFGGVVIFDRRPQGDRDAIYFFPNRYDSTYRIFKLLPQQVQSLINFISADDPTRLDVLPILPDEDNRIRVDAEESAEATGIYRDVWERSGLSDDIMGGDSRLRDVWDRFDYPSHYDKYLASRRASKRRRRQIHGEGWQDDEEIEDMY